MKMLLPLILAGAMAAAGCASTSAKPKNAAPPAPPTEAEMAAEQAAWMAYMTPGKEHAQMAAEAGEWAVATKMWMYPGAEPMESTATAKVSMILGGRYQRMEYAGDFMGMPFEGLNFVAFDNATKEYISTWIDSMGTGLSVMRGKPVDAHKVVLHGTMVDPSGGEVRMRQVLVSAADTVVMEMYGSGAKFPDEFKMMEFTMTRKR